MEVCGAQRLRCIRFKKSAAMSLRGQFLVSVVLALALLGTGMVWFMRARKWL